MLEPTKPAGLLILGPSAAGYFASASLRSAAMQSVKLGLPTQCVPQASSRYLATWASINVLRSSCVSLDAGTAQPNIQMVDAISKKKFPALI